MDELDRMIIWYLQEDGRRPFTEIASAAHVSEGTVRNRVTRLIEEGVLRVVGVVNPFHLGYKTPALIGVRVEPGYMEDAARTISSFEEVSALVMTSGSFDLLLEVFCRDTEHLAHFLNTRLHHVAGVRQTETFFILRTYKLAHRWGTTKQVGPAPLAEEPNSARESTPAPSHHGRQLNGF